VPALSGPERRRLKRTPAIVKHGRQAQRVPCLVLDSSPDGFRIGGISRLKRGQLVELILDEYTSCQRRCKNPQSAG